MMNENNGLSTFAKGMRDLAEAFRHVVEAAARKAADRIAREKCEHCGAESNDVRPVEDNDPSVGYWGTVLLCPACRDDLEGPDQHDNDVELDIMRDRQAERETDGTED